VELIETWGRGLDATYDGIDDSERGIIEAARQSTQGAFRGWDQDEKLLGFLYNNNHATPFEFAGAVIEVQAPIFIFREWQRHRTQSYNEMSARYAPLPDLNYMPTVERIMRDAGRNKQAAAVDGSNVIDIRGAEIFRQKVLQRTYTLAQTDYEDALANGVPKELARILLPVGRYSRMRSSANLRNWLAFMTLRDDSRAQWEIQQYAQALGQILAEKFPRTWALYRPRPAPAFNDPLPTADSEGGDHD
jgi:thymidylate synthase (FAD)